MVFCYTFLYYMWRDLTYRHLSVNEDLCGTGRRLVVLHWVKPMVNCLFLQKWSSWAPPARRWEEGSAALPSCHWAFGAPLKSRTSAGTSASVPGKNCFFSKTCQIVPSTVFYSLRLFVWKNAMATRKDREKNPISADRWGKASPILFPAVRGGINRVG